MILQDFGQKSFEHDLGQERALGIIFAAKKPTKMILSTPLPPLK